MRPLSSSSAIIIKVSSSASDIISLLNWALISRIFLARSFAAAAEAAASAFSFSMAAASAAAFSLFLVSSSLAVSCTAFCFAFSTFSLFFFCFSSALSTNPINSATPTNLSITAPAADAMPLNTAPTKPPLSRTSLNQVITFCPVVINGISTLSVNPRIYFAINLMGVLAILAAVPIASITPAVFSPALEFCVSKSKTSPRAENISLQGPINSP